jgi:uncharacterized membrane protein
MRNKFCLIIYAIAIAGLFSCKKEKTPDNVKTPEKYFPQVKAIVQKNCTAGCHAPSLGYMQGLPVVLETDSDIVYKGPSILKAVAGPFSITNHRMPPGGPLSASDIDIINQWLLMGGNTTNCGLNHE